MKTRLISGGEDLIGSVAMEYAAALQAQGDGQSALWYAQVATIFYPDAPRLLTGYGQPGLALIEAHREADPEPSVIVEGGLGLLALYADDLERSPSATRTGPRTVGGEVQAPKKISGRDPDYPAGTRLGRGEDILIFECIVDEDGKLKSPKVLRWSRYPTLILEVLEALRTWRFRPATLHGQPVAVYYTLTVNFHLRR